MALKSKNLDLDIVNMEYSSEKRRPRNIRKKTPRLESTSPLIVAKVTYDKAVKAAEAAKPVSGAGSKAFKLYGSLLSNKKGGHERQS